MTGFRRFAAGWILPVALLFPAAASAQRQIDTFYRIADSVAAHPPFKSELGLICRTKLLDRHINFVGFKNTRTILYATFTVDSLSDPVADVSPIVQFAGSNPSLGKVTTWAYVFDRNRDGRIDYSLLAGGAAPFKDKDFPEKFPTEPGQMVMDQLEFYVRKCRIIFNHWADDDFDDTLDAVIHADLDPEREWVERRVFARSSQFDGKFDEAWGFRETMSAGADSIPFSPGGVPVIAVGNRALLIDWDLMHQRSAIIATMSNALEQCEKGTYRLLTGSPAQPAQD